MNTFKELLKEIKIYTKDCIRNIQWIKHIKQFFAFVMFMLAFAYLNEHKSEFLALKTTEVVQIIVIFIAIYIMLMIIYFLINVLIEMIFDIMDTYKYYKRKNKEKEQRKQNEDNENKHL